MELEDILYIVIFAVVILSGFFRKKPKPKQPQYEPSEIEQMLATLSGRQTQGDDLYDDIPEFQEQPAPVYEQPYKPMPKRMAEPSTPDMQKATQKRISQSHAVTVFDEHDLTKSSFPTELNQKPRKPKYVDLKKAIIYSEILNRKY